MFSHGSNNSSLSLNTESVQSPLQSLEGNSPLNSGSVLKFSNHSSSGVLDRAWQEVTTRLSQFASDPGFTSKMNLAFGTDWNLTEAQNLFQGWAANDFSALPKVEIHSDLDILGANGAFVGETCTIDLSSDFLTRNADNSDAVANVLLEEIGHAIDFRINKTDAAGDEGDIFSRLVRGVAITANELDLLKMENDATTVVRDGKSLQIEQSSTLEVAKNIDGRLEEFTIEKGTNNVSFRWQLFPNGVWSNWTTMRLNGSELKGKELEVVENKDGRLELFVVGLDNKVWQTWQTVPGGLFGWSKPVDFGLQATEIEVSRNKDGRLESFAIDMNGELKQKWQTKTNSSWTGWNNFGLKASEIDVVQNQDGRLEIFGIGTDGEVWKKWQLQPNGISGWSGWDKQGLKATDVEVARNKDGRLEAFAIGTDGEIWQKWQTKINGGWTGWNQFGLKASEIEVTQNQDGRLEIFGIRTDGEVFQRWQQKPNGVGGWSNWNQFGLKAVEIEAARNADGRLELFAVDTVGKVEQRWQLKVNGTTGWNSWSSQGLQAIGEEQKQFEPPISVPSLFPNPTTSSPLKGFQDPVRGSGWYVSQAPGGSKSHKGNTKYAIDISILGWADFGQPVYAMRSGKIVQIVDNHPDNKRGDGGKGKPANMVVVELDGGYYSRYLHFQKGFNSKTNLQVGQAVNAGDLIGYVGNSGWSDGPHLHVEIDKGLTWNSQPFEIEGRFKFA